MNKKKLFHFTDRSHLESILREGLRPDPEVRDYESIPPADGVVWLTTQETAPMMFHEFPGVRITVSLSLNSRRLHHWLTWVRKHDPDTFTAFDTGHKISDPGDWRYSWGNPDWRDFWFYEGTITPDKFEAIDSDSGIELRYEIGETPKLYFYF
jgi:hypothetical protein